MKELFRTFSSKHLIALFCSTLILAIGSSVLVSNELGNRLSEGLRVREISLLYGAIEAGPLAIARLNSGALAADALRRLMANPSLKGRAIQSASIVGGPGKIYEYAKWHSDKKINAGCLKQQERVFTYPDSINEFHVRIEYDSCELLGEEREIYKISLLSIALVFLLVGVALALAVVPVVQSLRVTFGFFAEPKERPDVNLVRFLPLRKIAERALRSVDLEREASLASLAQQVAHDIRSPLAALGMISQDLSQLPEDSRVIVRHAIGRIRDIANQLLSHKPKSIGVIDEIKTSTLLTSIIDALLTEKRINFRSKLGIDIEGRIDSSSYGLFAEVQPTEYARIISNLINNSVEALGDKGRVEVSLFAEGDNVVLEITDNGKGIPPNILSKLGQKGETHGKAGGSGLGLYHARTKAEEWGGSLTIASVVGEGTTVRIAVKRATSPKWFVPRLDLVAGQDVVILDDDASIHDVWRKRFNDAAKPDASITLFHCSTPMEFRKLMNERVTEEKIGQASKPILLLCDYELLGFDQTGLDLIEECGTQHQAFLVTSRFDEEALRKRCESLEVPLVPKGLASLIPIGIVAAPLPRLESNSDATQRVDAVLIDDDPLVHAVWKLAARNTGNVILCFTNFLEFERSSSAVALTTPVYIDSNLSDGIKGETLIPVIEGLGFEQVFLATGYHPSQFADRPNIRVVGKDPPFVWRIGN